MAGRAALLAALAFRARLVLLLALAAVERLRQHRPGRAKLRDLGLQRLLLVFRLLQRRTKTIEIQAKGVDLPGQQPDRVLLILKSPQCRTEMFDHLRQRPDRALPGLRLLDGLAQIADLVTQRLDRLLDRVHGLDQGGVVGRSLGGVVTGGARHPHRSVSLGDGEACGPVTTDMGALPGRRPCRCAPFRNSSSRACLPTKRSRAAMRASYSWIVLAASASSSKAPASYLSTQIRIRFRDRSWRRTRP